MDQSVSRSIDKTTQGHWEYFLIQQYWVMDLVAIISLLSHCLVAHGYNLTKWHPKWSHSLRVYLGSVLCEEVVKKHWDSALLTVQCYKKHCEKFRQHELACLRKEEEERKRNMFWLFCCFLVWYFSDAFPHYYESCWSGKYTKKNGTLLLISLQFLR